MAKSSDGFSGYKVNPQVRGTDQGVSACTLVLEEGQSGDTPGYPSDRTFKGQFPDEPIQFEDERWNQIHPYTDHGKADGCDVVNDLDPYVQEPAAYAGSGNGPNASGNMAVVKNAGPGGTWNFAGKGSK